MCKEEIPFNYFYHLFQEKNRKKVRKYYENNPICDTELFEIFDIYNTPLLPQEVRIKFFEEALYDICVAYVPLAKSELIIYPKTSLEFVDLILNTMDENPYQRSFLRSLQFIYQDYLDTLKKGMPMLSTLPDNPLEEKNFLITLDSKYQITEFETINMDLIEQVRTMTQIVLHLKNNQMGPIPYVKTRYRKDI